MWLVIWKEKSKLSINKSTPITGGDLWQWIPEIPGRDFDCTGNFTEQGISSSMHNGMALPPSPNLCRIRQLSVSANYTMESWMGRRRLRRPWGKLMTFRLVFDIRGLLEDKTDFRDTKADGNCQNVTFTLPPSPRRPPHQLNAKVEWNSFLQLGNPFSTHHPLFPNQPFPSTFTRIDLGKMDFE